MKELLRRYSNFVGFPLNFNGEHVNTVQAIWSKSKSDVKPEEYDEFYQFIAHTDEKPLSYMHFSADAPIALNALLFIPRRNPEMFGFGRVDANVSLYCKRVLIDAKPEGLLPEWLRFLNGVVDSEDLPLNISREMLQDNSLVRKISDIITRRFIKHLEKLVNTVEVVDFRNTDNVYRETVLTRIGVDSATRHEVIEFCQILGAHIVDVTRDALTIEVTGGEYKIDRFLSLIEDYDVQMLTRSGRIALPKPCQ